MLQLLANGHVVGLVQAAQPCMPTLTCEQH